MWREAKWPSERVEFDRVMKGHPLNYVPIRRGSVEIYYNDKIIDHDDGKGKFTWLEGEINYITGEHTIRVPTTYLWDLYACYDYESEIAESIIRESLRKGTI